MITVTRTLPTPVEGLKAEPAQARRLLEDGYQVGILPGDGFSVGLMADMEVTVRAEDGDAVIFWRRRTVPAATAREYAAMIRRAVACGKAYEAAQAMGIGAGVVAGG